jgi:Ca2+-binding EF-hand superfamily protein
LTISFIILNLVFDAYDDDFDGVVSISHLETMLRAIGLILTRTDIAEMKKEIDVENRGAFELGAFFVIAARKFRDEHTVDAQARKAFLKISKSTLISGKWY